MVSTLASIKAVLVSYHAILMLVAPFFQKQTILLHVSPFGFKMSRYGVGMILFLPMFLIRYHVVILFSDKNRLKKKEFWDEVEKRGSSDT